MKPLLKNILIFVGIFILLVVGYAVFFGGKSATPALVTTGGTTGASSATAVGGQNGVGAQFLTTLLNLRNIKLDDSIFTDASFVSLQDFELTLIPETNPGRMNPFSPLGVDASTATATTTTGTTTGSATTTGLTTSTSSGQAGSSTGGPTAPGTGTTH